MLRFISNVRGIESFKERKKTLKQIGKKRRNF